jgi:hypothetical protein
MYRRRRRLALADGVVFMIEALFWYTGLAAWVLIGVVCVSMLAAKANDRSVARRRYNI